MREYTFGPTFDGGRYYRKCYFSKEGLCFGIYIVFNSDNKSINWMDQNIRSIIHGPRFEFRY
jgi:hypothetical protein